VKKTRKKQQASVLTSSEFTENKRKFKEPRTEKKGKLKAVPKSSMNKIKMQSLGLKKTAGNPEVDSHSCAEYW
jgi:hypothetical protein